MRFVNFKFVEGKNFLSFGDNLIKIDLKSGVNAIIGTNLDKEDSKNGAGKSTITELLYYALYGTTLREIPKDYIQNSITKKRCEVSIEFDIINNNCKDTYKIARKLNPTKCHLFKNNKDITLSTLAKTNAFIQELIRTPPTVFKNSVIMSVNTALPFMALPKTDKRKFVESVLGLEVFTHMILKAREDFNIAKKDYDISYSKYEQQQTEFLFNKNQLETYEITKQQRIEKLVEKNKIIQEDIKKLTEQLHIVDSNNDDVKKNIEKFKTELLNLEQHQIDLNNKLIKIQTNISVILNQLTHLKTNKVTCPTCKREYSDEHIEHVNQTIKEYEENILKFKDGEKLILNAVQENKDKIVEIKIAIENLIEIKNNTDKIIDNNKHTRNSLEFLNKNIHENKNEINVVQAEQNNELKGRVSTLLEQINLSKTLIDKLNNELNILESVKFIMSEEGIKSFIVKKILKILNSRLAFYLKKLETNCLCKFNEFFDEEIIDENGQTKSYFNFSGGERKRIDLACLFTFADIRRLQGDVIFNTIFYDELLDSSLDDKGVHLALKVLRDRYNDYKESCYIITHRGPEVTTKAEHTIHVTKQNGLTTISDRQK